MMALQSALRELRPVHDYFIGIDSDGCVFDTMEVKQKEFFIPNALKHFGLFAVAGIVRKTWEFVNLYSIHRGGNRFISIIKVFELLSGNEQVIKSGIRIPDMRSLRKWTTEESSLTNETLRKKVILTGDTDLEQVLRWSEAVNDDIARWLKKIPPFYSAKEAIEMIHGKADIVIISQTPLEAIEREWEENGLKKFLKFIAAQEHGTKTEHLALAAKGKYSDDRILMIGDAKGDLEASRNNNVLFYPI
ncbi:MAG TPA: HAD hydrolase-like protein, partial [Bacteroidales bacterium]|nr:HAD hydrolase-like protein [Bacteroidales bacterium]